MHKIERLGSRIEAEDRIAAWRVNCEEAPVTWDFEKRIQLQHWQREAELQLNKRLNWTKGAFDSVDFDMRQDAIADLSAEMRMWQAKAITNACSAGKVMRSMSLCALDHCRCCLREGGNHADHVLRCKSSEMKEMRQKVFDEAEQWTHRQCAS